MGAYRGYMGPGVKECPKIRGTLFGGPHSKDYSILGSTLVRVFIFRCLVFFVVWAFLFFLAVCAGACFIFCCLGGVRVFFCCLGGWRVFVAVWAGACYFFLLFGRRACSFFCCLGGGRVFFCCLGGGREFTHLPVCLARL